MNPGAPEPQGGSPNGRGPRGRPTKTFNVHRPSSPHQPSRDLRSRLNDLFNGIIDSIQGFLPDTSISETRRRYPWIKDPKPGE